MTGFDAIVIGAGISGASAARALADGGMRVLVLEERGFAGGNARDHIDGNGVLVHDYGPHIFHTDDSRAYDFLSRFTGWNGYRHTVLADIPDGSGGRKHLPVPFGLGALRTAFGPVPAARMESALLAAYPGRQSVPVLELMEHADTDVSGVGIYVYEHIFRHYTAKQWGMGPGSVDRSVTARVPVRLSHDTGYFTDRYQGLPAGGYSAMFGAMLGHPRITVETGTDALRRAALSVNRVLFDGAPFNGPVVYTGRADRLFGFSHGVLPYRSVRFLFRQYPADRVLPCGTVNYTMDRAMTRATEFRWLTGQDVPGRTTVCEEYPCGCSGRPDDVPCYPVASDGSRALYGKYAAEASRYQNLHLLGRLARYEYLDMDDAVIAALEMADRIMQCG